ncbi:MAG TPA: PEGA domain-containing protein [Myxococcota bacterium]|jgi:hypothetical protein|nr:PEGA domain-containing protein [Myxococcota bacterium]
MVPRSRPLLAALAAGALGLVAAVLAPSPATAASPHAEAKALVKAGDKAFAKGDYEAALDAYQKAFELDPEPLALERIGQSHAALRHYADARDAFLKLLELAPKGKKHKEIEALVTELSIVLETRLRVDSDPPGATVYIDSKTSGAVGTTPFEINVVPGPKRLYVELADHAPYKADVDVAPSTTTAHEAKLAPLTTPLQILSSPGGASVEIDGVAVGRTPWSGEVRRGERALRISLDGHEPAALHLAVGAEPLKRAVTLRVAEPALGAPTSRPRSGTVSPVLAADLPLEGKPAPLVALALAAGPTVVGGVAGGVMVALTMHAEGGGGKAAKGLGTGLLLLSLGVLPALGHAYEGLWFEAAGHTGIRLLLGSIAAATCFYGGGAGGAEAGAAAARWPGPDDVACLLFAGATLSDVAYEVALTPLDANKVRRRKALEKRLGLTALVATPWSVAPGVTIAGGW